MTKDLLTNATANLELGTTVTLTGVDGAFQIPNRTFTVGDTEALAKAWEAACKYADYCKVRGKTGEAWIVVGTETVAKYHGQGKFDMAMSVLG